ncbi:MAG: SMI1/KNR4 family protein [Planctomycetaceae bacterium]
MRRNLIQELVKVLPPPSKPLDTDESLLVRLETCTRTPFPADFIEFGKVYGSGQIKSAYSWEVWSPFRSTYPLIILEFARTWELFRDAMELGNEPFRIFPQVGGLLPFAQSDGGDWVCWETVGEPDEWGVVDIYSLDEGQYERLDMGFSEYFYNVLTRKTVLNRHREGDSWNPETDLSFSAVAYNYQDEHLL